MNETFNERYTNTQLVQKGEWRVLDLESLEAAWVLFSATLLTLCITGKLK